jgi:hypothetical protein
MKNQGDVSSPNPYNSTTESKENELAKISDREFRNLLLKMINDLKDDTNKQINELENSFKN